jgi:hypothetical protein
MWLLLIITILTAVADDRGWGNQIRFHVGIEFNLYLILTILGVIGCFLFRGGQRRVVAARPHPLLLSIMIVGGIAWLIGLVGSVGNFQHTYPELIAIAIRDFIALPLFVLIGYSLTATPQDVRRMVVASIVAGALASVFIVTTFVIRSGQLDSSGDVTNALRVEAFTTTYPAIACLLLAYAILIGIPLPGPRPLLLGICLFGVIAPLNRSDWISLAAALGAIIFLLPRGRRLGSLMRAMAVGLLVVVTLWSGLFAASKLTGRDFYETFGRRIASILPSDEPHSARAWDSRLPGIMCDLEVFRDQPIFGGGFGVQERMAAAGKMGYAQAHHCPWTDLPAKTGFMGLLLLCLVIFGPAVLGRRMMRDGVDQSYVLLGAAAVAVAAYSTVLAASTMSINLIRGAIPIGVLVGVIIRAREMQLLQRVQFEQEQMSEDSLLAAEESGALADRASDEQRSEISNW